mmetsp:Transcript_15448/g.27969  ORF Transcript_15448/g.27969 Transcript_15448/m.27969 type:complete len:209 (+) Transcript_15448:921-1547(+)
MLVEFPWRDRWLNGLEYEHLILNCEGYMSQYGFKVYKEHPSSIYSTPVHGLLYFLREQNLRDLGFPRVKGLKKRYKWKKMNFVTPLPKQRPRVHYLVATGKLGGICYRMHIVEMSRAHPLLCHMLKIQTHFNSGVGIPPRQHFKENTYLPLAEVKVEDQQEDEELEPPKPYLAFLMREPREMHPVVLESILARQAFFRCKVESEDPAV